MYVFNEPIFVATCRINATITWCQGLYITCYALFQITQLNKKTSKKLLGNFFLPVMMDSSFESSRQLKQVLLICHSISFQLD